MSDHSSASANEVYSSLTVGSNPRNSADVREHQLRKPKKHLSYNSFKSNIGIYSKDIQLFPLELRPVLDDEERKSCSFYKELLTKKQQKMEDDHRCRAECNSRHRIPRRPRVWDDYPGVERNNFTYGHDVYRNILGPTPDESILAGLQTVIDIMGLSDLIPTESQTIWGCKGTCPRPSTRESWRADMKYPSQGSSQEELTYPMTTPRRPYSDRRYVRPPTKRGSRESFGRTRHDNLNQPTATTTTDTGIQRSPPSRPKVQYTCRNKDFYPGNSQSNGFAERDSPKHDCKTECLRRPSEQPITPAGSGNKDCYPGSSQSNGFGERDIPKHDCKTECLRRPSEQPIRPAGSGNKDCYPGSSQSNGFGERDIPKYDCKTECLRRPSEQPIRPAGSGNKTFQVSSRKKCPPHSADYDMSYNKQPPCPDCTREWKPHTINKHDNYKQDLKKPPHKVAIYETARREHAADCIQTCSQTYQNPQKTYLATQQEPAKTYKPPCQEMIPGGEVSSIQVEGDNDSASAHKKITAITYQASVKEEIITSTPDNSSETITTEHGDTINSSSLSHKERSEESSEKIKLAILHDLKLSNVKDAIDTFGKLDEHTPMKPDEVDITEEQVHHTVEVKGQGVKMKVEQMHAEVDVKIVAPNDGHGGTKKKPADLPTDDGTSDESDDDKIRRKRHKRTEIRRKAYIPTISFDGEHNKDDKHMSDDDKHSKGYSQIEKVAVGDCGCKNVKPSHPPKDLYATPNHLVTSGPTPKRKTLTYYEMCKYIQTDEVTYSEPCTPDKCMKDECCGPDLPCMQVKTKHGQSVCIQYRPRTDSKDLTAQTFPPINLPSVEICGPVTCDCPLGDCICSPCCMPGDCDEKEDGQRKNCLLRDAMHKNSASSHLFEPVPCNKDYKSPEPKCKMNFRGSGMSVPPVVQPVIGICRDGKCGQEDNVDKVEEVRYAMVRISIFNEYTTYEVLKSTSRKPKRMPPVVEGIFVTKR